MLYVLYLGLLITLKSEIAKSNVSEWAMWPLHVLFLCMGLLLFYANDIKAMLARKKSAVKIVEISV